MKGAGIAESGTDKDFVPVPIDSLKWKVIDDYVLNTSLGTHICRADVLDSDEYVILKPGEGERLERIQVQLFCDWVIETRGIVLGTQLKYLLEVFSLSQSVLAEAMQISQSAISQLIKGQISPSRQTSREVALLFRVEAASSGFIASLARGVLALPVLRVQSLQEQAAVQR